VKRVLAASPEQWPWSSFQFYYLNDSSVLSTDSARLISALPVDRRAALCASPRQGVGGWFEHLCTWLTRPTDGALIIGKEEFLFAAILHRQKQVAFSEVADRLDHPLDCFQARDRCMWVIKRPARNLLLINTRFIPNCCRPSALRRNGSVASHGFNVFHVLLFTAYRWPLCMGESSV
jgi:hypothetical protein